MAREGDNENDEYYVPTHTISGRRVFKPNRFEKAASTTLGLLTFQCNSFPQTSRPGSIETIKNEVENVSIFKATMDHMDLITRNSDDGSINLAYPRILAAESSQKDNLHLGKAMKADNREDFMKSTGKEIIVLTAEDFWDIIPK